MEPSFVFYGGKYALLRSKKDPPGEGAGITAGGAVHAAGAVLYAECAVGAVVEGRSP